MVTVKTNQRIVEVPPITWDDVTTDSYQKLMAKLGKGLNNDIVTLSHLYGLDYDLIESSTDQALYGTLMTLIRFISDDDLTKMPAPEYITYKDQAFMLKYSSLTIGQMLHLQREVQKRGTLEESISIAVAVALQPLFDQTPFKSDRALEIEKDILLMPINRTYPIGFFYLRKFSTGGNVFTNAWHLLKMLTLTQTIRLLKSQGLRGLSHSQI